MSVARYVVDAVVLDGRGVREVAPLCVRACVRACVRGWVGVDLEGQHLNPLPPGETPNVLATLRAVANDRTMKTLIDELHRSIA